MPTILFAALTERWNEYEVPLRQALTDAGLARARLVTQAAPEEVDYIVYAPNSGLDDFSPYTRLKAILNLWAGVEDVIDNPTLKVPLTRMVDEGLTQGMVEWVTAQVFRYHLGLDEYILGQNSVWRSQHLSHHSISPQHQSPQHQSPQHTTPQHTTPQKIQPLAQDRHIGILGLGELGMACASALQQLHFNVCGWSRTAKNSPGMTLLHGDVGLKQILNRAQILVLLLPNTPDTQNIMDAQTLAQLPRGAKIINPGRGQLIDDDALLEALNRGQISHATLDVFRVEPLPSEHPFWAHPQVTVTPHIASQTRPQSASRVIAENICRCEAGEALLYQVNRARGY